MTGCAFAPQCVVPDRQRKMGNASAATTRDGEQNLTKCPDCNQHFCYAHYNLHRQQTHGG